MEMLEKYLVPVLVSLGFHGVLLYFLLVGWIPAPTPREIKQPNFVQAKLVKLQDQSKTKNVAVDKPQVVDLEKKRREQERLKQQAEQKKQQELKIKQEKAKQDAEKKQKAEAERKKKDQQLKAKEEADRKARSEAEKKQQEQARRQKEQQAFEQALAQEEAQLADQSSAVAAQSYMNAIAQQVVEKWSRPPSSRNGMQCSLLIRLVPTGRVVSVDVLKGSGNAAFDLSAVQAVKSVEQFDVVKDMPPEVFERHYREFEFNFIPQDLRQ
jgi:colicin import membrane protein